MADTMEVMARARVKITLLNGTVLPYSLVPSPHQCRTLQSYPGLIKEITCSAITHNQLEYLAPLLATQMSRLENLDIVLQTSAVPECICLCGPMLDLPTTRFDSLERLQLDGLAVNLVAPLLPGLRHLILKNYPGIQRCLPLPQFMAAMASCNLETLELHNYGGIVATKTTQPQDSVNLSSMLKKLVISDTPPVTSQLLQALHVPADANIHVNVDVKGFYPDDLGHMFAIALPAEKQTLPILKEINTVDVSLVKSHLKLTCTTAKHNSLVVEIDLDFEFTLGLMARDHLYESTIRNLERVFHDPPAVVVNFIGDFARVTADSWRAALSPFPKVTMLMANDTGKRSAGMLPLLDVLGNCTGTSAQMTSPKLDTLCVRGPAYGFDLLGKCLECVNHRQAGPTKLKGLGVALGLERVQDDKPRLQEYKNTLAQLVDLCIAQARF